MIPRWPSKATKDCYSYCYVYVVVHFVFFCGCASGVSLWERKGYKKTPNRFLIGAYFLGSDICFVNTQSGPSTGLRPRLLRIQSLLFVFLFSCRFSYNDTNIETAIHYSKLYFDFFCFTEYHEFKNHLKVGVVNSKL